MLGLSIEGTKPVTQYERHPLSAEYADLEGEAWECFLDGFRNYGFLDKPIVRYDGKILDGWQRYRACTTLGIQPTFQGMPEGITPEEYVRLVNDERRHESAAAKAKRVADRRERVAAARVEGKSLRTIAEEEGVSKSQVVLDLKEASTVQDCTVEPKDGKVTGKDGKTRMAKPATAPKAEANGKHEANGTHENNGKAETPEPLTDTVGTPIPERVAEAFTTAKAIAALCCDIDAILKRAEAIAKSFGGRLIRMESVRQQLKDAKGNLWANRATHVCPYCHGEEQEPCQVCRGEGWTAKHIYEQSPGNNKRAKRA